MGALHHGHLTLVRQSLAECGVTVCSIFVNPTQFNDAGDLERYPRTPEKDREMLEKTGCQALFLPETAEIYPENGVIESPDLSEITGILEGAHRPGHFKGVAQVVRRFFEIVEPDRAYFGSKDYQQVMVIRELVKRLMLDIRIISCPIIREADGLAMSSRNALLSADERKVASVIPAMMSGAAETARTEGVAAAIEFVNASLAQNTGLRLDYYTICDPATLRPLKDDSVVAGAVALIAVWVGKIRLIDNCVI